MLRFYENVNRPNMLSVFSHSVNEYWETVYTTLPRTIRGRFTPIEWRRVLLRASDSGRLNSAVDVIKIRFVGKNCVTAMSVGRFCFVSFLRHSAP